MKCQCECGCKEDADFVVENKVVSGLFCVDCYACLEDVP